MINPFKTISNSLILRKPEQSSSTRALQSFAYPRNERIRPGEVHQVAIGWDNSPSTLVNSAQTEIASGSERLTSQVCDMPSLRRKIEFAIFGFGENTPTKCYCDFTLADAFKMPPLPTSYGTWIYELYIEMIDACINQMAKSSRDYDQDVRSAWLFFFSDFLLGDPSKHKQALEKKHEATEKAVNIFIMGAGDMVDEKVACELAQASRPPVWLKDVEDFTKFFDWLLRSLTRKGASMPGQQLRLENFGGSSLIAEG
ncbi:vWA domain-containing protein [Bythopirellula goksoeyrii]|uniref:Uncharacterized protein n=1 Tax=Bythopirellula goksoeyrii TaxID=1400387 RepID=A0A5B9QQ17_9BACT|nr:hypothetical protein [Bythopirellula goksoeyrii]QEG36221.1 hypothetical protein Pr1d_35330 [Bythopirellula goksoeyrii]